MKSLLAFICLYALPVSANVETTLSLTSDYILHGISQTNNQAALQLGIEKSSNSGAYIGVWASNVDFAEQTKIEVNYYLGKQWPINNSTSIDIGATQVQYLNQDLKKLTHHSEVYISLIYNNNSQYKLVCSNDFEGFNPVGGIKGKHCMALFSYQFFPVENSFNVEFEADYSRSFDQQNIDNQYYLHSGVYFSKFYGCCQYVMSVESTWLNKSIKNSSSHFAFKVNYQF